MFIQSAIESLQCIYYTTVYSLAIHKNEIKPEVKAKMGEFLEESKKEQLIQT